MTFAIQRYKYCKQVMDNNLDRLAKVRNENLTLKEEAKGLINSLEKKLKWYEDSH